MKLAFSKPTREGAETDALFGRFRGIGYDGLQLKAAQYAPFLGDPARFLEGPGHEPGAASGLIAGGRLDEAGVAHLRRVFAFGRAVGTELVIFCHGETRQGLTPDVLRGHARRLSELAREARGAGLRLSLHNHFGQPVMTRGDIEVFFEAAGGAVGLTVDTAHLVKSGVEDVAGVIRDFGSAIDNFHLKDISAGEFRVLGEGKIDFAPVFTAIRGIGYDGWVSTDEESGADVLGAMGTCLRFMREGLGAARGGG